MSEKIFFRTSEVPRAQQSTAYTQEGLWENLHIPEDSKKIPIKIDKRIGFSGEMMTKLNEERDQLSEQGKSDDEILSLRLQNTLSSTPKAVCGTLLSTITNILKRVDKTGKPFIIYASRHGEKDENGQLSEKGKEQTRALGKQLAHQRNNDISTLILTTHFSINEGLLSLIFPYETFPPEWEKGIHFAEPITYSFLSPQGEQEAILEVERRGIKKQISLSDLQKRVK